MRKIFFLLFLAIRGFSEETADLDIGKVSEAMGHMIGKNLQNLGLQVDINAIVKGIQDSSSGKSSPLSEDECVQAISALQEESLSATSEMNLKEANAFLEKNGKEENVVSLEEGKVQYKIEKSGEGPSIMPYNSPVLEYKASYLNGPIFGTSHGDELLSLDEAIPGFSKGIIGMQEGEIRTLYIHPDLGYGKQGNLHPNSLLIFEVKAIKADASAEASCDNDRLPQNLLSQESEVR